MSEAKTWYRIERNADGPAEIFLYDEIGAWGIGAGDFVRELQEVEAGELVVRINSPGGSVDDGVAIFEALQNFNGQVTTRGDAAVYSIASVIMQAGDKREMAPRARMLVHEASTFVGGTAKAFEDTAARLRETTKMIAGVYAERSGKEAAYWLDKMEAETRFTAQETVDEGLADSLTAENDRTAFRVAASFKLDQFRNCADIRKELEDAAKDLGVEPIELPDSLTEVINKAVLAVVPDIRAAVLDALKEANKRTDEPLSPGDAARRELEARLAAVRL